MPAKIRLRRVGRRGQPSYRVVVVDEEKSRNSAVIEELGYLNPIEDRFEIDTAQALDWLKKGAQPTPTARDLLSKLGVMAQWHAARHGKDLPETKEPPAPQPGKRKKKTATRLAAEKAEAEAAKAAAEPAAEPEAEAEAEGGDEAE